MFDVVNIGKVFSKLKPAQRYSKVACSGIGMRLLEEDQRSAPPISWKILGVLNH